MAIFTRGGSRFVKMDDIGPRLVRARERRRDVRRPLLGILVGAVVVAVLHRRAGGHAAH